MANSRITIPSYQQVFGQDESDDEVDHDAKTRASGDLGHYDQQARDAEEEGEKLMAGGRHNPWQEDGSRSPEAEDGPAQPRSTRRSNRNGRAQNDEKVGLVHDSTSPPRYSSSNDSLDLELEEEKLEFPPVARQPSRVARFFKRYVIPGSLSILFILIAYGAYRASQYSRENQTQTTETAEVAKVTNDTQAPTSLLSHSKYKSNGTALFAPTTILVSLDGFRADFLQRGLTPTLNYFISQGVSPKYMTPSFPSVTFPNHFTMVTGLYPESHGVVGNTFWDPEFQAEFSYHDPSHSMDSKWWTGEPIWLTAERQNVRTATHMWPGSEAHIGEIEPAFVDKYNGSEGLSNKVDRVFELIDKPGMESPNATDQRPQLVLAYVPNVDADGHKYGPNSTEITETIRAVDALLFSLLDGLQQRNLTDIVNVVVVSDHGMATTSTDRLVQLEEIVDMDMIEHIDGWPHYGLRPKSQDPEVLEMLYNRLLTETAHRDGFDVYLRDKTMPERYHFSKNDRIAPLWLVAKTGWAIVTHDEFNVQQGRLNGDTYHPRGIHGYDHENPLMRAIFVARGPAFPHEANSRIDAFQNTNVYNIICDSVGVTPVANNGTLRLPFRPIGLHTDFGEEEKEDQELAADPPKTTFVPQASTIWNELTHATVASSLLDFIRPTATMTGVLGEVMNATAIESWVTSATATDIPEDDYYYDEEDDAEDDDLGDALGDELGDDDSEEEEYDAYGYRVEATATPAVNEVEPTPTGHRYTVAEPTTDSSLPSLGLFDNSSEDTAENHLEYADVEDDNDAVPTVPSAPQEDFQTEDQDVDDLASAPPSQSYYEDEEIDDTQFAHGSEEAPLDFEPTRPITDDESQQEDEAGEETQNGSWFGWFGDRLNDVKGWVSGLVGGDDE